MIPFAVMTADGRSKTLNAQRTINMFAEKAPPGSVADMILRSTPGLSTFGTYGTGPIRGVHVMDSVLFIVTGTDLYSVDSAGAGTLRGSAGTIAGTGFVHMASNAIGELMIANSSGVAWLWDGSTLATVVSYDADFGDDATSLTFLDQYFLFTKADTGQVHAFDLNTGKSYDPLSFGTAESSPDNAVQVYAFGGDLWIFGEESSEVFRNSGATTFPFERIPGVVFEDIGGVLNTVADVDGSIHWRGVDGIVYAATGFQPQRISTHDIENRIKDWTNQYAFTYKDEGHAFYVLGSSEGCVVFDRTTGFWHERDSFTVGRWRANSYGKVYGKHLVGDYLIGRIYEMSLENYEDGTNFLQRRIISPPLGNGSNYMSVPYLQVHFEHGVGISGPPVTEFYSEPALLEDGTPLLLEDGSPLLLELSKLVDPQGTDPRVIMDWSADGRVYSNEHWASIGKIGEYEARAIWRRTGTFRQRVYRLTYTDPTVFVVYGASL